MGKTDDVVVNLIIAEIPYLRRLAIRIARNHSDADDLVQETLLRAFKARASFTVGTAMRAWLTTIMRRIYFTQKYTHTRRRTFVESDAESGSSFASAEERARDMSVLLRPADADAFAGMAVAQEIDEKVFRALKKLSSKLRVPFLLHHLAGWDLGDIADVLGIPVGTAMSRVHRARAHLQAMLEGSRPKRKGQRRA